MTDRSSRAGAVLWLGFFAASAIVLSSIALLGPTLSAWLRNSPLPSEGSKAERRRHLEYPLRLDGLGLDTETLLMGFDRHGRLASIDAGAD